jgi:hypothetical protein
VLKEFGYDFGGEAPCIRLAQVGFPTNPVVSAFDPFLPLTGCCQCTLKSWRALTQVVAAQLLAGRLPWDRMTIQWREVRNSSSTASAIT